MKTRIHFFGLTMVMMAMSFVGCPSRYITPTADMGVHAFVYNPADEVYTRFYTSPDGEMLQHEITLAPADTVQVIKWQNGEYPVPNEQYDSEYNDLHVRKLSNKATAYVLRSAFVILNGQTIAWEYFPSRYYAQEGTQNHELPYIEQVIDTLLLYYPESVVAIDDLQEHSIYNDKSGSTPPSITINDTDE